MRVLTVTVTDHNWPMLTVIIDRGGKVKHLNLHYDKVDQEASPEVAESLKLVLSEIRREHNPGV